jgi:hypothetical protein
VPVAEVFGLKFSGFSAWWLWRTIYLLKLPGVERKVRVALDWTLDLFFPRDIVDLPTLDTLQGGESAGALEEHESEACHVDIPLASSSPAVKR